MSSYGGRPASGLAYIQSNKITTNALNPYIAAVSQPARPATTE